MDMRKFLSISNRGVISLPVDVRQRHHLDQPGAQVELVEREDGVIELYPHVPLPAEQAWFWTAEWQEGERSVESYLERGEISVFESVEDFSDNLEQFQSPEVTEHEVREDASV